MCFRSESSRDISSRGSYHRQQASPNRKRLAFAIHPVWGASRLSLSLLRMLKSAPNDRVRSRAPTRSSVLHAEPVCFGEAQKPSAVPAKRISREGGRRQNKRIWVFYWGALRLGGTSRV